MTGIHPAVRMRPVELDEDVTPRRWHHSSANGAPTSPGVPARSTSGDVSESGARTRRWPWLSVAALVALGALLVAGNAVDSRQRALADRIAAVPGLVRPMQDAPVELWRAAAAEGPGTVLQASGSVVLVSLRAAVWWVTAYEPRSGAQRWTVPVAPTTSDGGPVTVRCPWAAGIDDGVVLCIAGGPRDSAAPARVIALDAVGGRPLGRWAVDGPVIGVARVGDDLVLGSVRPDGRVRVQRSDGLTGTLRWEHVTADVVDDTASGRVAEVAVGPRRTVVRGAGSEVLDDATGSVLVTAPVGVELQVVDAPGGFATFGGIQGGRLYRDGSDSWVTLRGRAVQLEADDGSAPGLLVVDTGPQLRGVDRVTGTVRWQLPTDLDAVAVASGVLVTAADGVYGAVDVRTGAALWQVRAGLEGGARTWVPRTDGTQVIGLEVASGGALAIVGRGLRDGIRTWSVPAPVGTDRLDTVGGRLLARGPADVVVLG